MYNNNNYYEAPYDDQADSLEEQIYDLVKNDADFDPTDIGNLSEAIGQDNKNVELQEFIRDCVEKRNWEALGRKLYMVSYEYQEAAAEYHLTK